MPSRAGARPTCSTSTCWCGGTASTPSGPAPTLATSGTPRSRPRSIRGSPRRSSTPTSNATTAVCPWAEPRRRHPGPRSGSPSNTSSDGSPIMTTITRRGALTAAATLAAAKALLPSGAFAAGPGPEVAKARLGFIALTDASPLIIAKERGLFAKYGMPDVEVLKQASWAGVRDNLVLGSGGGGIDGSHILTPMPYLLTTGQATGGRPTPMNI